MRPLQNRADTKNFQNRAGFSAQRIDLSLADDELRKTSYKGQFPSMLVNEVYVKRGISGTATTRMTMKNPTTHLLFFDTLAVVLGLYFITFERTYMGA